MLRLDVMPGATDSTAVTVSGSPPFTYAIATGPAWLTVDAMGVVVAAPPAGTTAGTYNGELRASNSCSNDVIPVQITVQTERPTIAASELIYRQTHASPVQPEFGNSINDQPVIRSPSFAAIADYMVGRDQTFVNDVKEPYGWLWLYAAEGHDYGKGLGFQARRFVLSSLSSTTNAWTDSPPTRLLANANLAWQGINQQGIKNPRVTENAAAGTVTFRPNAPLDGAEIWHQKELFADRARFVDARGWAAILEMRVVDAAGNPYYGADGRGVAQLGNDQYGNRYLGGDRRHPDGYPRWYMDGGNGANTLIVGGDWQPVAFITRSSFKKNENPFNSYAPGWPYSDTPWTLGPGDPLPSWAI